MKGGENMNLAKVVTSFSKKEFESELNKALQEGSVQDVKFNTILNAQGHVLFSAIVLYSTVYVGQND